jgi:hypothetical protein
MLITLLLHVALAVPPMPAVSPAIVRAAVAEAAGVWAPYGVAIDAAAPFDCAQGRPCGWATDDSILLTVVTIVVPTRTRRAAATAAWRGALGAITFDPDGAPMPVITVFLTDLQHIIAGARMLGMHEWQWPPSLRDEIFGRVLGRVLAHEIGHYMLRSRQHAPYGLMQSLQFADDLVAPSRHRFTLTPAEAARLEVRR